MTSAIPAVNFGVADDFSLGVEEELLLVDPETYALDHSAPEVLGALSLETLEGAAFPDTYAGLLELTTPVCDDALQAARCLTAMRHRMLAVGATAIGAGLHPTGTFGDVVNFPSERYRLIKREMRGLLARTPTCALHVHVGMPDPETALRALNAMRAHLPLLQALAANSPFWHGRDSGLASARAQVFRAFPRSEIPPAFSSFEEYVANVEAIAAAGEMPDYTFLWWDIRLHPVLGTVELRAMDSQASLGAVIGLAALVQSLARRAVEQSGPWEPREVLMESSFRAARDGLDATFWHEGRMRSARDVCRDTVELVRPYARELGSEPALEEIDRLRIDGNGAARQRVAFARGGMQAMLAHLAHETAHLDRAPARA